MQNWWHAQNPGSWCNKVQGSWPVSRFAAFENGCESNEICTTASVTIQPTSSQANTLFQHATFDTRIFQPVILLLGQAKWISGE